MEGQLNLNVFIFTILNYLKKEGRNVFIKVVLNPYCRAKTASAGGGTFVFLGLYKIRTTVSAVLGRYIG